MPIIIFQGKIEPVAVTLNFDFVPEVNFYLSAINLRMKSRIEIINSAVSVTCDVDRWNEEIIPWLLNYVYDFVNAEIDLITFASGRPYFLHIDSLVTPTGLSLTLLPEAPEVRQLATALVSTASHEGSFRVELKEAFEIVCTRPALMLALRDACAALKPGSNTLANCGRAIEGMRKALWGDDEKDSTEEKAAWAKLRTALNLSKAFIQNVTDASRQPRHGSSAYLSPASKQSAIKTTWIIMNRLLIFYRDGQNRLPLHLYPEI